MTNGKNCGAKVGTSLSMLWGYFQNDAWDIVKQLHDKGFEYIDMDFWDWCYDKRSPFIGDGWEDWVKRIKECGDELGVTFHQSHSIDSDPFNNPEDREWYDELIRRCIVGSSMLGVKWTVFHCANALEPGESEETKMKRNVEYFTPIVELAAKYNVGIALENMPKRENGIAYATCADELCRLADAIGAPNVGFCLDTGHANCSGLDQYSEIIKMGKRLKALHVHDNDGIKDRHTAPFNGTIDWKGFMRGLREVGYDGVLTYEADTIVRNAPDKASKDAACRMMYHIGKYLLNMEA